MHHKLESCVMAKAKERGILETIEVEPLRIGKVQVWLKGRTPLIMNRLASKARRELLMPKGKKTTADKQQNLKHNPLAEYRDSMSMRSGNGPTRLVMPSPAVKGSMATAALETKGTNKTQIGRLVWVEGYSCDVYGVPQMFMAPVRSADMNRTPDIRTRALLPEWCVPVTISYVQPQINDTAILQLLANGGIIVGVGDFRQEKGKGNFGQFEVCTKEDCEDIIKAGGMKQQDAAIKDPNFFDADTAELFGWFETEVKVRGKSAQIA